MIFSRAFTNPNLGQQFPELFGTWGLIAVLLWGLAYGSVARGYRTVPGLLGVFALEKLVYVVSWIWWLVARGAALPALWQQDPLSALFFSVYGVVDLAFGAFFFALYRSVRQSP